MLNYEIYILQQFIKTSVLVVYERMLKVQTLCVDWFSARDKVNHCAMRC